MSLFGPGKGGGHEIRAFLQHQPALSQPNPLSTISSGRDGRVTCRETAPHFLCVCVSVRARVYFNIPGVNHKIPLPALPGKRPWS